MADITSAEAIAFCDAKIRVAANRICQAYYFAKALQQEWFANDMGSLIPNDASPVRDGANPTVGAANGRHPIVGSEAVNVVTRCGELVTDLEANNSAKLNTLLAVANHPTGDAG